MEATILADIKPSGAASGSRGPEIRPGANMEKDARAIALSHGRRVRQSGRGADAFLRVERGGQHDHECDCHERSQQLLGGVSHLDRPFTVSRLEINAATAPAAA
jgi:hypothetical protein